MSIFDVITLFGGLAMFLYGMRLMGNSLRESSSGTLKVAMEKVTNNPIKAFLLGVFVTAVIQSSTATIVITAGLVGAGIITLKQSLGIIIGANVGTTVTGQIIRLLDVDASGSSWLQIFKPSTLAPLALILGIILIMGFKAKKTQGVGSIAIGFGILFSGLLNMTGSVNALSESGAFDSLFSNLSGNPILGYATGAGVAFVLQSSSATIGILQAFSLSGDLTFKAIYAVVVGIYLGDCVTTAIVCSIGAKAEARRVGIVNILFNLSETVLVLVVVTIVHSVGLLDSIWEAPINSGGIANTNTVFNLGCAICLFPLIPVYEKLARKIIKEEDNKGWKYEDKIEALNPSFFSTPAIAFRGCYNALLTMLSAAISNISIAIGLLNEYDEAKFDEVMEEEDNIDRLTDGVSHYLAKMSPYVRAENHVDIFDQYFKTTEEFERLGDHAVNISECAKNLAEKGFKLSDSALEELRVLQSLLDRILEYTTKAFQFRDIESARHIEPLEQVVDDLVATLKDNHYIRLREGECDVFQGTVFMDVLTNAERISDICSNVGIAVVARVEPDADKAHNYTSLLHQGANEKYNKEYNDAHEIFFGRLEKVENK